MSYLSIISKIILILVFALSAAQAQSTIAASTQHAIIININAAKENNAQWFVLTKGSYVVEPINKEQGGEYDSFNPWGKTPCENTNGCEITVPTSSNGWFHSYKIEIPISRETFYSNSPLLYPEESLGWLSASKTRFQLEKGGLVGFSVQDSFYEDNLGGISIKITPED